MGLSSSATLAKLRPCANANIPGVTPFARRVTGALLRTYLSDDQDGLPQLNLQRTLRQMAYYFPPVIACQLVPATVYGLLAEGRKRWQGPINGYLRILATRAALHDAFLKEN